MFQRQEKIHVFALYTLSIINGESDLSEQTRHLYERLISLLHRPLEIEDFHEPDFEEYVYIGERRSDILEVIEKHPDQDIGQYVNLTRKTVKKCIAKLENDNNIIRSAPNKYSINYEKKVDPALIEKYKGDEHARDNTEPVYKEK